jgi:competence protein ComEC
MDSMRKYWRETVIIVLICANLSVWFLTFSHKSSNLLHVYFLNVGQGDSIFIDSPTHGRVLLDGGPDRTVLSELGKILPFGDRRIDVMIESHPDADHIGGLVDVLKQYKIGAFIEPGVDSTNQVHITLENEVRSQSIPFLLARRGMNINFGDGTELLILYPNQNVKNWETNDASIVAKLVYGSKSFLLTGDSTKKAEYDLLGLNRTILKSTVLKAGHHGSATSSSLPYVEAVKPEYAIISAGKNNKYGLPKQVTLDTLTQVGARILSTINLGTIEFETNGNSLVVK